jgi:hypothetical protein
MNVIAGRGPDEYSFGYFDDVIASAVENEQRIEAHHLVWGYDGSGGARHAPWVPDAVANDGGDPLPTLQRHIDAVVEYIVSNDQGAVSATTVVNEPLSWGGGYGPEPSGSKVWSNFWNNASAGFYGDPRHYVAESFHFADEAFGRAGRREGEGRVDLLLNEWKAEIGGTAKGDDYLNLAYYLRDQGAPIDGVGFQMHLWPGAEDAGYVIPATGEILAFRNEYEIVRFAELFRGHALAFPPGMTPFITEFGIDTYGWARNLGYDNETVFSLSGLLVYEVAKALIEAGGRSLMFFDPAVVASKADGRPYHRLREAIALLPEV